ncbi:MAG: transglutaminase-like domain-containing protein, partial [Clostridia bacterium]|nr:transglutaminase-like domain-containing protein [Clostridia bacterium]
YVWFTDESALVQKSIELCAGATDNYEKINILYGFVSEHMLYDYIKAVSITPPYLPDTDETLRTGRGICFDFAVLLAGMLRVQGIPTQLVIGKLLSNNSPMDHAWNKVFLDGNWLMVDPTFKIGAFRQADYVQERVY